MKLFAYQERGRDFLASHRRCCLWDEQGLGKSGQVVAAADKINALRILWIGPAGTRAHVRAEVLAWQAIPRTVWAELGAPDLTAGIVIVSYEQAATYREQLCAVAWDVVVLDEHHYLKNVKARRTKAVLARDGIAHKARRIWALSGTPMPNNPSELWPILRVIAPEVLHASDTRKPMGYWDWLNCFCHVEDSLYGLKITGAKNIDELRQRIERARMSLRRIKTDVLRDLPPIVHGWIELGEIAPDQPLDFAHEAEVAAVIEQAKERGEDLIAALLAEFEMTHLSTLVRLTGEIKAGLLAPLLADELEATDHKLVIGYWHRHVGDVLFRALAPFGAVRIDGSTSPAVRTEVIREFQTGAPRIFLGQIRAAGTGISLTAASQVVMAEQSWVPADNSQFAARPHRVGQQNSVLVRTAFLANSVDEPIARALARKSRDIAQTIDATTQPVGA